MDRASLKELYDNRDLIAQIFDLRNQLEKMPNTGELCKLKRELCVFFDYLPTLVLEDKDAKIQATYTFEKSPKCDEKTMKDVDDVDETTYLTKDQVEKLIERKKLVLEDKDAKIQATYTFEKSPKCNKETMKGVDAVDETTYLTKKQVQSLIDEKGD